MLIVLPPLGVAMKGDLASGRPKTGIADAPRRGASKEPAWHRRTRRQRQQARLLSVVKAAQAVRAHHADPIRFTDLRCHDPSWHGWHCAHCSAWVGNWHEWAEEEFCNLAGSTTETSSLSSDAAGTREQDAASGDSSLDARLLAALGEARSGSSYARGLHHFQNVSVARGRGPQEQVARSGNSSVTTLLGRSAAGDSLCAKVMREGDSAGGAPPAVLSRASFCDDGPDVRLGQAAPATASQAVALQAGRG